MANRISLVSVTLLAGFLATGCASIDRMGSKLDMAAAHINEPHQHEYEGRLVACKKIGSMTSLQFADGQYYDVTEASLGLQAGDTVRIYKTEKGYQAMLWVAVDDQKISSDIPAQSTVRHRS